MQLSKLKQGIKDGKLEVSELNEVLMNLILILTFYLVYVENLAATAVHQIQ